jgi:hypothetical protein
MYQHRRESNSGSLLTKGADAKSFRIAHTFAANRHHTVGYEGCEQRRTIRTLGRYGHGVYQVLAESAQDDRGDTPTQPWYGSPCRGSSSFLGHWHHGSSQTVGTVSDGELEVHHGVRIVGKYGYPCREQPCVADPNLGHGSQCVHHAMMDLPRHFGQVSAAKRHDTHYRRTCAGRHGRASAEPSSRMSHKPASHACLLLRTCTHPSNISAFAKVGAGWFHRIVNIYSYVHYTISRV